jgi:indole-3-glycerol phosphate synthase
MPKSPGGILGRILAAKRVEVAALAGCSGEIEAQSHHAPPPRDFLAAIRRGGAALPRVIAEIKRASPSAGAIRAGADATAIAREYEAAGAAAISVLTDREFFGGSLSDLRAVHAAVRLPCLRKDFVIDPLQVVEARGAGADAILLIAALLDVQEMRELGALAHRLGMAALVEVHDEAEAAEALSAGATVIGVNHRDLKTFTMDMTLYGRLRPRFAEGRVGVAESGIRTADDVRSMAAAGADAILVGESLMKQPSPGEALRALLA